MVWIWMDIRNKTDQLARGLRLLQMYESASTVDNSPQFMFYWRQSVCFHQ
jgi:hypothetical protein